MPLTLSYNTEALSHSAHCHSLFAHKAQRVPPSHQTWGVLPLPGPSSAEQREIPLETAAKEAYSRKLIPGGVPRGASTALHMA